MCGRFVTPEQAAIERAFHIGRHNERNPFAASYNVAPTTTVPMLRRADDGALELLEARWGIIPSWHNAERNPRFPTLTFNARSEEAAKKPTWSKPLRRQRCLMPMAAWYEWQEKDWTTGEALKVKQPWALFPREPEAAFAGIFDQWKSPAGLIVVSCALLSQKAAPGIAHIHDRMPTVLPRELHERWLDPELEDPGEIGELISRAETEFTFRPVSRAVGNVKNQGAQLLEPLAARAN